LYREFEFLLLRHAVCGAEKSSTFAEIAQNGRNSAHFAKKTGLEKVSALLLGKLCDLFSEAHWQSGFGDTVRRMQSDHKPMMLRSPGFTFFSPLTEDVSAGSCGLPVIHPEGRFRKWLTAGWKNSQGWLRNILGPLQLRP